jgi:hypothetical protein
MNEPTTALSRYEAALCEAWTFEKIIDYYLRKKGGLDRLREAPGIWVTSTKTGYREQRQFAESLVRNRNELHVFIIKAASFFRHSPQRSSLSNAGP